MREWSQQKKKNINDGDAIATRRGSKIRHRGPRFVESNSLQCDNWDCSFINGRTGNDFAKRISSLFVLAVHFIPLLKRSRSASSVRRCATRRNCRRQAYPFSAGQARDQERDTWTRTTCTEFRSSSNVCRSFTLVDFP